MDDLFLEPAAEERANYRTIGAYNIRYYDSLYQQHAGCGAAAARILVYLTHYLRPALPLKVPARENHCTFQADGTSCGAFVAFFATIELRRLRGEGSWASRPNIEGR